MTLTTSTLVVVSVSQEAEGQEIDSTCPSVLELHAHPRAMNCDCVGLSVSCMIMCVNMNVAGGKKHFECSIRAGKLYVNTKVTSGTE